MSDGKGMMGRGIGWGLRRGDGAGVGARCGVRGGDRKRGGGGAVDHGEIGLSMANDVLDFLAGKGTTTGGGVFWAGEEIGWGRHHLKITLTWWEGSVNLPRLRHSKIGNS